MAKWAQHEVKLRPYQRGCHLITDQACSSVGHLFLSSVQSGEGFLRYIGFAYSDPKTNIELSLRIQRWLG